jgi:5'(3')-deoxyribonucleotidase
MRPIILLDVDGIFLDFHREVIDVANAVAERAGHGFRVSVEEFPTWDMKEGLERCGAPNFVISACLEEMAKTGFNESARPDPEAVENLPRLQKIGDVVAVTAPNKRCDTWIEERIRWMWKHFGMHVNDIVFTRRKEIVRGDFFADDKPENVLKWRSRNPDGMGMLWNATYNESASECNPFRVYGWNDAIDVISKRWR